MAEDIRMKLDPTLKRLGTVLRRRMADVPAVETSRRIANLLDRLSRAGQGEPSNGVPNAVPNAK